MLETQYNWKGICCEPIPKNFEKLVKNRPNSICINEAVYNSSGLILTFDISEQDLLSGIAEHIDAHKSIVDKNKTSIKVKTISLLDVLDNSNAPQFIEYMSLDTEGSEFEILKNFDFNKYTFGLIDVEHNYIEPRRTNIKNLLILNGYIYIGQNDFDDMYKHKSMEIIQQNIIELDNIFIYYGTDKSSKHHNYVQIYGELFESYRYSNINICEIGIGTIVKGAPSSMKFDSVEFGDAHYKPGASLRSWRDYFINANIILGVDVQTDCMFTEDNIQTILASSFDSEKIKNELNNIGYPLFDIIIDDGLHTIEAITGTFTAFQPFFKNRGYYIVEDMSEDDYNIIKQNIYNKFPYYKMNITRGKKELSDPLLVIYLERY